MKTIHKKALFLHQESREYRGLYRVRDLKNVPVELKDEQIKLD